MTLLPAPTSARSPSSWHPEAGPVTTWAPAASGTAITSPSGVAVVNGPSPASVSVNAADPVFGSARNNAQINAAVQYVAALGGGRVFVSKAAGPWTIGRSIVGDQTAGGILIEDGRILAVGPKVTRDSVGPGTAVTDCAGQTLIPGLVDMRVFTGEPGTEYRETLASASRAAAAGGVTTMIVMPNTKPVIDDAAIVDFILLRARDTASVRVAPMAAITKGLNGELMTEIGGLSKMVLR